MQVHGLYKAVTSKKVLFATLFAGLGYSNYDVDFGLLGNYTTETQTCNNLISLNYAHNGVSANVGIRLKLLFLTLHGEYAIQDYNTLTAGVSIR